MAVKNEKEYLQGQRFLESRARSCALKAGIEQPEISLDDGTTLGCLDVHVLSLSFMGRSASVKIGHGELSSFLEEGGLERANEKVRKVVSNLLEKLDAD